MVIAVCVTDFQVSGLNPASVASGVRPLILVDRPPMCPFTPSFDNGMENIKSYLLFSHYF